MKNKIFECVFIFSLILSFLTFGGIALASSTKSLSIRLSISNLPNSQELLKEIQKFSPSPTSNWSSMCVKKVFFRKSDIPDIAIVTFEDEQGDPYVSFHVLRFVNGKWKVAFTKGKDFMYFEGLKVGKAMENGSQQVIVYCHEGSGNYLYYFMVGQLKDKLGVLLSDMQEGTEDNGVWPNGQIYFHDGGVLISSGSQGTLFKWNGKKFTKKPYILRPNLGDLKRGDVVIAYKFLDNGDFSAIPVPSYGTFGGGQALWSLNGVPFESNTVLKIKVGNRIYLDRQNFNDAVEYLYWDSKYLKFDFLHRCLIALKAGKTDIEITNRYTTFGSIDYVVDIEK